MSYILLPNKTEQHSHATVLTSFSQLEYLHLQKYLSWLSSTQSPLSEPHIFITHHITSYFSANVSALNKWFLVSYMIWLVGKWFTSVVVCLWCPKADPVVRGTHSSSAVNQPHQQQPYAGSQPPNSMDPRYVPASSYAGFGSGLSKPSGELALGYQSHGVGGHWSSGAEWPPKMSAVDRAMNRPVSHHGLSNNEPARPQVCIIFWLLLTD